MPENSPIAAPDITTVDSTVCLKEFFLENSSPDECPHEEDQEHPETSDSFLDWCKQLMKG